MSLLQTRPIELYPRSKLHELSEQQLLKLERDYSMMAALYRSEGNFASMETSLRRRREVRAQLGQANLLTITIKNAYKPSGEKLRHIEVTITAVKWDEFNIDDEWDLEAELIRMVETTDFWFITLDYKTKKSRRKVMIRELDADVQSKVRKDHDRYFILEFYLYDHDYGRKRYDWSGLYRN